MSDDNKQSGQEYQYPEGEYIVDGSVDRSQPQNQGLPPKMGMGLLVDIWNNNKRVMIITLLASLIAMIFKFVSAHKSAPSPTDKVPSSPAIVQPAVETQPSVSPAPEDLREDLINLNDRTAAQDKEMIGQLRSEVDQLKSSIDNLNNGQAELGNTLASIGTNLSDLQESLKPKKPAMAKKLTKAPIKVHYNLRAVIPGRAWILGSDGSSVSVAVGSKINQYGTVQRIDPDNGLVVTSSGKVIGFNANDS